MSFRKDSKKWKKTNKNLKKHKKQKGGAYDPSITGNFSTNEFFNYYLEKYSESIQTKSDKRQVKDVLFQPFDASLIKEQEQNILYVIDMQNDFIDDVVEITEKREFPDVKTDQRFVINGNSIDLYRKLGGPGGTGNFAVTEGNAVVKKIIDFIENNHKKFHKIIFTRDWHPRDHCSFNDKPEVEGQTTNNTGHYPPHCVFNTLGACFAPAIKEKIQYDGDNSRFIININDTKIPIDIIFKGFHQDTDSYTAEKWPENEKQYPIKPRQLSSCCPGDSCKKENTGGYKLKEDLYKESNEMIIYKGKDIVSNFEDMFDKGTPLLERNQKYNFYVVGLAGDFCVKDTAINLKNNYTTSKVYVIQELTRYVFIPAWVPLERLKLMNPDTSEPCVFEEKLLPYGEWLTEKIDDKNTLILSDDVLKISDPNKALSSYMFDYNPLSKVIKRLKIDELISYKNEKMAFGVNDNLWHFTTDHRTLVKDYYNNEVIILKSKPKRLLCISDLEGCSNNTRTPNSAVMCKTETFDTIDKYLNDNTEDFENHVAFLGDYFDQGPFMMQSINGIGKLIDKYIHNKVHIILGNRDINKFRILYEAITPMNVTNITNVFGDWQNKLVDTNNNDISKKTENLLATYGALELLNNIKKECESEEIGINGLNQIDIIYIIGSIFNNNVDVLFAKEKLNIKLVEQIKEDKPGSKYEIIQDFIKNARKIFFYGKLISTFELEKDYNVLMSHAGSYNKYIFNIDKKYYDSITVKEYYNVDNYYNYIEEYRKKFTLEENNNGFTGDLVSYSNNNDDKPIDLKTKINNINSIYTLIITKIFKKDFNSQSIIISENYTDLINKDLSFRSAYFILQALGLNITQVQLGEEGGFDKYKFVSPIASCGVIGGCYGIAKQDDEIIRIFSDLNIKYVASGHVPHCVTVPIIYQRKIEYDKPEEVKRVVFVNCDTSNGNTPPKYKKLNTIPLAYITKDKVGISSLSADGKLDATNTKGYTNINDANLDKTFQDLVKDWYYENAPTVQGKSIRYGNNQFLVPNGTGKFEPMTIDTNLKGGRRICSKKMIRKCKNKLTKKKRHSKQHSKCC